MDEKNQGRMFPCPVDRQVMQQGGDMETITLSERQGLKVGDVVQFASSSRWPTLKMLLLRPRHKVVIAATKTTITLGEVRMTWSDWWRCIWRTVVYGGLE